MMTKVPVNNLFSLNKTKRPEKLESLPKIEEEKEFNKSMEKRNRLQPQAPKLAMLASAYN